MRNRQIYNAPLHLRSKQLACTLNKNLRREYGRRNVRVIRGDTVKVVRGEYDGITGRVSKVDTHSGRIAIDGIKREKGQGEKIDVMIHASKVILVSLNRDDEWRMRSILGEPKIKSRGRDEEPPSPVVDVDEEEAVETSEDAEEEGWRKRESIPSVDRPSKKGGAFGIFTRFIRKGQEED